MLYAKDELNNIVTARKGAVAFCPGCQQQLMPKCGAVKIHHWAHTASDCDAWTEPITQWHLEWQAYAALDCREVVLRKGEVHHRADIRTKAGVVVEIQHSTISQSEIKERERFYGDMCWVFDLTQPSSRYEFLYRADLDKPEVLLISEVLDGNDLRQYAQDHQSTSLKWMLGERINADYVRSQHQAGVPSWHKVDFEKGDPILGESSEHTGPVSPVRRATHSTGLIPSIGWHPIKYRTAVFQWKNPKKHVLDCRKPVFLDIGSPHWMLYIDQTHLGPSLYRPNRFLGVIILKADFVAGVIQANERRSETQNYSFIASAWANDIVTHHYGLSGSAAGVMRLKQHQIEQHQSVLNAIEEQRQLVAELSRQQEIQNAKRAAKEQEVEKIKAESKLRFSDEYWAEVEQLWQEVIEIIAPGARRGSSTGYWKTWQLKSSSAMRAVRHYKEEEVDELKVRIRVLMRTVRNNIRQCQGISAMHRSNFYASIDSPLGMMRVRKASAVKVAEDYKQLDQDCLKFMRRKEALRAEQDRQRRKAEKVTRAAEKRTAEQIKMASQMRFSPEYWTEVDRLWREAVAFIAPGAHRSSLTRHLGPRRLKSSSGMDAIRRYGKEVDPLKARVRAVLMTVRDEVEQCEALRAMHRSNFYASLDDPLGKMQARRDAAAKVVEDYKQLDQDCYQFIQQAQAQQAEENKRQYELVVAAKRQAQRAKAKASLMRFTDHYWAEVEKGFIACKTANSSWDTYLFQSANPDVIERALKATGNEGAQQRQEAEAIRLGFSEIKEDIDAVEAAKVDSYVEMSAPLQTITALLTKIEKTIARYKALEQQFPRLHREQKQAAEHETTNHVEQGSLF